MRLPDHGANMADFYKGIKVELLSDALDFSVNTNPLGLPQEIEQNWDTYRTLITNYPEPRAASLRAAIANKEGLPEEMILVGNGGSELIYFVASLFQGENVLLIEPTFSEYSKACTAYGVGVKRLYVREADQWRWNFDEIAAALQGVKGLFITNPNNPTGIVYEQESMKRLLDLTNEMGIYLIVDEAFFDFTESDCTLLPELIKYNNLIILRSFTKMYHIPGIRLGVLYAHPEVVKRLEPLQPEWSVNSLAIEVGKGCLQWDDHVVKTKQFVKEERTRVQGELSKLNFVLSESGVNFYLLREQERQDLMPLLKYLASHGIVARHTYNFRGLDGYYIRLAVRNREDNDCLIQLLRKYRSETKKGP